MRTLASRTRAPSDRPRVIAGRTAVGLAGVIGLVGLAAVPSAAASATTTPASPVCDAGTLPGPQNGVTVAEDGTAVFVGGDYRAHEAAAESEGRLVVGGDVTIEAGLLNLGRVGVGSGVVPAPGDVLVAGGDVTVAEGSRLDVNHGVAGGGDVRTGGTFAGVVELNGGTLHQRASDATDTAAAHRTALDGLSAGLAELAPTGDLDTTGAHPRLVGDGASDPQVFSITTAEAAGLDTFVLADVGDASGTWSLADGEELALDGFPVGTTCEVTEDEIADDNGTWTSSLAPADGTVTITEGDASAALVTVTNTFTSTVGAFTITKEVAGDDGGTVDEFTVDWVCTAPDGTETDGSATLAPGETSDPIGDLPVGTTCAISEPEVDDPAGTWVADITPDEITIGSEDATDVAAVTVTNTFSTEPVGGFTVTKVVDGDASAATVREFSGTWTCSAENLAGDASGVWSLADGGSVAVDGFPVGTTCEVAEDDVSDDAGTWASSIDPAGALTLTEDGAGATVVTVTNTFTPTSPSPSPSPSESTPAPSPSDSTPAPSTLTPSSSTTAPAPGPGTGTDGGTGSGEGGTLPRTGAQVATAVALAALLVGGGALAMLAARRRRG